MDTHQLFVIGKFKEVAKLVPENSKVLDIGCNDGQLNNFLRNCKYYGIDINPRFIKQLSKRGIKAKKADLNKDSLPFNKEKFDFIFLLDVLEHVINPSKLLQEAKERLTADGKMVITLPNDYHILNKMRFIFNKHLTEDPFAPYGHLHYFPIKSGEKFLMNNNLKILKRIPLPPIKPKFAPQKIKNFLTKFLPQTFARDILYLVSLNH